MPPLPFTPLTGVKPAPAYFWPNSKSARADRLYAHCMLARRLGMVAMAKRDIELGLSSVRHHLLACLKCL